MIESITQECTYCVMSNAAYQLAFDERGRCEACLDAAKRMPKSWIRGPAGTQHLKLITETLKRNGRGKQYDAMIGLSGGIDSAYLAHFAVRELGLRVLAVHVDGGWNSSAAVQNIEKLVRGLNIDLYTHVVEWAEMADLQLAFLKSGVLNQDMPQDHAFFSVLYEMARKFKLNYFLSGVNFSSECVLPNHNAPTYLDARHIRAIHALFGETRLKAYKFMSIGKYIWNSQLVKRPKILKPLDYFDYNKEHARDILEQEFGWIDYGEKHSESRFTKFYQEVYLPRKHKFDKRRLHLSSRIVAGQITREDALSELAKPITTADSARRDIRFVSKKLGLADGELEAILDKKAVDHLAYPNDRYLVQLLMKFRGVFDRERQ